MVGHSHVLTRHRVHAKCGVQSISCVIVGIHRLEVGTIGPGCGETDCSCMRRPTRRPTSTARPARSATAPRPPGARMAPPPQTACSERAGGRRSGARERTPPHFRPLMRLGRRDAGLPGCWRLRARRGMGADATGLRPHPVVWRCGTPSADLRRGRGGRGAALLCVQALYWPEKGQHWVPLEAA